MFRVYGTYFLGIILLLTSCAKDFNNPYDSETSPDAWMPSELMSERLDTNALRLTWQQSETHIDHFLITKTTGDSVTSYTVESTVLELTDPIVVSGIAPDTCVEVNYMIKAIAGDNISTAESLNVVVPLVTNANAGSDITANTDSIPLNANAPKQNETGIWSVVSGDGGQFVNASEHNTVFIGQICSSYTLRWTLEACNGQSSDDVVVDLGEPSIMPYAGPDQSYTDNTTNCQLMATLLEGQTGEWSVYNGNGGSFSDATSPTSIFYGIPCESYQLRWSITDCGGTSSDYVFITFDQQTTQADAGPDQSFSDNTVQTQLSGNTPAPEETGQWSVWSGSGGSFSDATSPNATFYGQPSTNYQLRWSIGGCSSSTDYMYVQFN